MKAAIGEKELIGTTIAYGKMIEDKDFMMIRKTDYFNYGIAFNSNNGLLLIVPVDAALTKYDNPIFISSERLKKASLTLMGTVYQFDLKDGKSVLFEVPKQSYQVGKVFGHKELQSHRNKRRLYLKSFLKDFLSNPLSPKTQG